jgi:DNA-binding CsgD family transcriptional regulator
MAMTSGYTMLTDKEKEALRLLLRGHDAKSSARALSLSVHTVNERLRDARRKLGVTSSREAARIVLAAEGGGPELLGDTPLADASAAQRGPDDRPSTMRWWAKRCFAVTFAGVAAMSLLLAVLFAPASPLAILPGAGAAGTEAAAEAPAEMTGAEMTPASAAERFLILLDESRWAESYAATGEEFRRLNTLKVWTEVSERVRPQLGKALNRALIADEFVPAPPAGYQLVKFHTRYENGTEQVETLSLVREDGGWKVSGIVIG